MKMVFVSDEDYKEGFYNLTNFKIYDVELNNPNEPIYSSIGIYYEVINDIGESRILYESNFIHLEKWRDLQINKII